jgi:hypothetical protein
MTRKSTTGKGRGLMSCLSSRHESTAEAHSEASPFLVEFFMVQVAGFRCMAYQDFKGKWHHAFNDIELPETVRVLG